MGAVVDKLNFYRGVTMVMVRGVLFSLVCMSLNAYAATPYQKALDKKASAYLKEGVVIGGTAGKGFSLLGVRRDVADHLGMERVILDLGDELGNPLKGGVSYFQAQVQTHPPRVVVDLAQLSRSRVNEAQLKRLFNKSPYVRSVSLTSDPEDKSSTLVLHLKEAMLAEVFEMPAKGKASRIVIDLKKAQAAEKGKPSKTSRRRG